MFSVVDAVLLRPLPYREPDRLVRVIGIDHKAPKEWSHYALSPQQFDQWRAGTTTIQQLAVVHPTVANLTGLEAPERVDALHVSAEFFTLLGAQPKIGQWFSRADELQGAAPRVILTERIWRSAFGADPRIVGRTVYLDRVAHEVVGVARGELWIPGGRRLYPDFAISDNIAVFLPLRIEEADRRNAATRFISIARLAAGATVAQAEQELNALQRTLALPTHVQYPATVHVQSLHETIAGEYRLVLQLLLAAVVLLFLIVVVNVANLSLGRWMGNAQSLKIRQALGASRWQLTMLCLHESSILAAAGVAGGLLLARWALDALRLQTGIGIPRWEEADLHISSLLFGVAMGAVCALLIGLIPAWRATVMVNSLVQTQRNSTLGPSTRQAQRLMVSVQVALAFVLVSGSILLALSLRTLLAVPQGYRDSGVSVVALMTPRQQYPQGKDRQALVDRIREECLKLPGVESVAAVTSLPMHTSWNFMNIYTPETENLPLSETIVGSFTYATRDYFQTVGLPLLEGRLYEDAEVEDRVVVISATAARQLFPGRNPIGAKLRHLIANQAERVIGVVGDVRSEGLDHPPSITVYRPLARSLFGSRAPELYALVRSRGTADMVRDDIRRAVAKVDPMLAVPSMGTLDRIPRPEVQRRELQAALTSGFGGIALFVAVAGIYGVVAFSLALRRKELAIRMALGAEQRHVRGLVWREALTPVLWGILPGLLGAVGVSQLLRGMLYGVSPLDAKVLILTPVLLLVAGLIPAQLLAVRACRISPASVMQGE